MFTQIQKVMLWITVAVGVLFSLIGGGSACSESPKYFWWVAPVGIIATLIFCSLWGMVIEMADNMMKSRHLLEEIASNRTLGGAAAAQSNTYTSTYQSQSRSTSDTLNRLTNIANGAMYGETKRSAPSTPSAPLDVWYCGQCGYKNINVKSCMKCGSRPKEDDK